MIKCLYVFILILLIGPFLFCLPIKKRSCFVSEVIDGDTLKIKLFEGSSQYYFLRINYIDALEKGQGVLAERAINHIKMILRDQDTNLDCYFHDKDMYGRFLGDIVIKFNNNQIGLSEVLVKEGLVFIYPYAHFESFEMRRKYLVLNSIAMKKQKGIFKEEKILTPWAYRRKKKQAKSKR